MIWWLADWAHLSRATPVAACAGVPSVFPALSHLDDVPGLLQRRVGPNFTALTQTQPTPKPNVSPAGLTLENRSIDCVGSVGVEDDST